MNYCREVLYEWKKAFSKNSFQISEKKHLQNYTFTNIRELNSPNSVITSLSVTIHCYFVSLNHFFTKSLK